MQRMKNEWDTKIEETKKHTKERLVLEMDKRINSKQFRRGGQSHSVSVAERSLRNELEKDYERKIV